MTAPRPDWLPHEARYMDLLAEMDAAMGEFKVLAARMTRLLQEVGAIRDQFLDAGVDDSLRAILDGTLGTD
jgi:hypothetical protein